MEQSCWLVPQLIFQVLNSCPHQRILRRMVIVRKTEINDCAIVQKRNWPMTLGNSQFNNFIISLFHNFTIYKSFKIVLVLKKQLKCQQRSETVRVGRRPGSCRCGLPRAEGRKVAAARGEGRSPVAATESSKEEARRLSGQRVAETFQAAERRSASRQRFVVTPVGAYPRF